MDEKNGLPEQDHPKIKWLCYEQFLPESTRQMVGSAPPNKDIGANRPFKSRG